MDKKRLAMYEEEERQVIRNDRFSAIGDGHISNPEGIFPDIDLPDHRALHRGTSPLSQLCFLYEKTCVYVPPTTAGEIAARLALRLPLGRPRHKVCSRLAAPLDVFILTDNHCTE